MEQKKQKEIIYYRESALQSIISDTYSLVSLLSGFYLNERFINGNNWVDAILTVLFVMYLVSKGTSKANRFTDKKALLDYLNKDERN